MQGHRIKLKRMKRKTKQQNRRQSVVAGRQQLYCAVQSRSPNHCRKSTVFSSRRNVVSDGAFLTDDGRLFHACAEATGKARSPSVERLVDGTTSMAESAKRRRRRVSTVDVRCPVHALSKVRRRCSLKTVVGQNAQPECDSLLNS